MNSKLSLGVEKYATIFSIKQSQYEDILMYAHTDMIESYRILRHKRRTGILDAPSAENIQEKGFHLLLDGKSNIS